MAYRLDFYHFETPSTVAFQVDSECLVERDPVKATVSSIYLPQPLKCKISTFYDNDLKELLKQVQNPYPFSLYEVNVFLDGNIYFNGVIRLDSGFYASKKNDVLRFYAYNKSIFFSQTRFALTGYAGTASYYVNSLFLTLSSTYNPLSPNPGTSRDFDLDNRLDYIYGDEITNVELYSGEDDPLWDQVTEQEFPFSQNVWMYYREISNRYIEFSFIWLSNPTFTTDKYELVGKVLRFYNNLCETVFLETKKTLTDAENSQIFATNDEGRKQYFSEYIYPRISQSTFVNPGTTLDFSHINGTSRYYHCNYVRNILDEDNLPTMISISYTGDIDPAEIYFKEGSDNIISQLKAVLLLKKAGLLFDSRGTIIFRPVDPNSSIAVNIDDYVYTEIDNGMKKQDYNLDDLDILEGDTAILKEQYSQYFVISNEYKSMLTLLADSSIELILGDSIEYSSREYTIIDVNHNIKDGMQTLKVWEN